MAEVVRMPKLGFDMAEGTLVRWVIAEGEPVQKGAVIAEIETDKATVEVESAFEGVMALHLVQEGAIVPVNTPIVVVSAPGEALDLAALGLAEPAGSASTAVPTKVPVPSAETPTPQAPPAPEAAPEPALSGEVRASPLARRLAREQGVDLRLVRGSGPGGRIVRVDVESYRPAAPAAAAPQALPAAPQAAPAAQPVSAAETVALSRLRSAIGRRMVESKQQAPHFYVTHEFNMTALMALRKEVNALLPEEGKISVNDFIVRAVSLALQEFPNLNASINEQKQEVTRHGQIHVGIAVALESGLLTVVCRDANQKPLRQIAGEVRALVGRARTGKVRTEDIEGSTFSISNLGMFDVEHFIAIINPPEAAILAVGSVREVPVVENGEVKPGLRMKATLSVDHRISDGVEAARFLQLLAKFLEEPVRLMI